MKTEQKLEVYRELFGSLPDVPEGKEFIGVEYRPPKLGDYYYDDDGWFHSDETYESFRYPVAIFQDTHRSDGTPLSIDPLPEVEGYRVEYKGVCITPDHVTDEVLIYDYANKKWVKYPSVWQPGEIINSHWCNLYKIAQPTTLADLVGEDGQKNFYVIQGDDSIFQGEVDTILGTLEVNNGELTHHINKGRRWSHSPFTKYEDANVFIPA